VAKTYQELIGEARDLLQDSVLPNRFTDQFLTDQLNRGLQDIGRIRPDAYYNLFDRNTLNVPEVLISGTPDTDTTEILWTEDVQIELQFYTPLVVYVVGSAELTDDEYTLDNRAGLLLSQFHNSIIAI